MMNMQDRLQVATWLRSGASLSEVENTPRIGLVGNVRFSENAVRLFRLLWLWSAYRFGGFAGAEHDAVYKACGKDFYNRRIDRCQAIIEKIKAGK